MNLQSAFRRSRWDATPRERDMLKQQLAQLNGNEDTAAMLRALRKRMNITVVEARL